MASFWFIDDAGERKGPVEQDELHSLIGARTVRAETLVWTEGMPQWASARDVAALSAAFAAPPPPNPPQSGQARTWPSSPAQAAADSPAFAAASAGTAAAVSSVAAAVASGAPTGAALTSVAGTWELFWRGLLAAIGGLLVVPSPWTSTGYLKYLGETTQLPGGRPFSFDGQPRDIWWAFVGQGLLSFAAAIPYAGVLAPLVSIWLSYVVLQWFCAKLHAGDGGAPLSFEGGLGAYFGWCVLMFVSFFTIIGWAWAFQFFLRWACRNVRGPLAFDFTASGLDILWRSIVVAIACSFVIPIPWAIAWLVRWFVSQISVADARVA